MTPSGLSIGIILKTNAFLNFTATSSFESKKSNIPFITKLELDSPG